MCEADLAHTRAPRIVKLHGSLGTIGEVHRRRGRLSNISGSFCSLRQRGAPSLHRERALPCWIRRRRSQFPAVVGLGARQAGWQRTPHLPCWGVGPVACQAQVLGGSEHYANRTWGLLSKTKRPASGMPWQRALSLTSWQARSRSLLTTGGPWRHPTMTSFRRRWTIASAKSGMRHTRHRSSTRAARIWQKRPPILSGWLMVSCDTDGKKLRFTTAEL